MIQCPYCRSAIPWILRLFPLPHWSCKYCGGRLKGDCQYCGGVRGVVVLLAAGTYLVVAYFQRGPPLSLSEAWVLIAVVALFSGFWLRGIYLPAFGAGTCRKCGGSLAAGSSPKCSACGLINDVFCPTCGYSRRGADGGVCPECGEDPTARPAVSE